MDPLLPSLVMQINFASSQGIHPREIKGIDILKERLPKEWYAFANLEMIDSAGGMGRQIDVAIVMDDRILLADIKDWNGRISCDGDEWLQNGSPRETSPVRKIADNVRLVASRMKGYAKKHLKKADIIHPFIDSCVILTGHCNIDDLDEGERSRVFHIEQFCRLLTDRNLRRQNEKFRSRSTDKSGSPTATDSPWRNTLHKFFMKSGEFRPQEKTYTGHKVTTGVVYTHPDRIYVEHDCVEVSNERSAGLLRLWDFSTPTIPTKFASEEYRSEIAGREQTVLSYLIDRNPEVERMTLRPKVSDLEKGMRYWEIFERRKQLGRLRDFVDAGVGKYDKETRLELLRVLLSHAADLHRMGAAHLDIGRHSVWVEAPATVRLSHFMTAHYQENRSIAGDRYHFLSNRAAYPEDILGGVSDHFRKDVFLLGRAAHMLLLGMEPPASGGTPEWSPESDPSGEFPELHAWFAKALEANSDDRFKDADKMLEGFNEALRGRVSTAALVERLQTYRKWKYASQVYRDFPMLGDPIKEDDRVLVYLSETADGPRIVKLWKSANWTDERTDAASLLDFCDRAELLTIQTTSGLAPVRAVAYLGDHLLVVSDHVGHEGLDALLVQGLGEHATAFRFIMELIDVVDALHAFGFGHGDLSPGNIRVRQDGEGLHPVIIDLLEYGGNRLNPAYSPSYACGSMERDRFAVLKIAEEILSACCLDEATSVAIGRAVNFCRDEHPKLSTLQPLKDVLCEVLNPKQDVEVTEITFGLIGVDAAEPMLADEGNFYVLVGRTGNVSIVGADSELNIYLGTDKRPRSAQRRRVDQRRVADAQRYAVLTLRWRILLELTDFLDTEQFDAILGTPEVQAALGIAEEGSDADDAESEVVPQIAVSATLVEDDQGVDDVPTPQVLAPLEVHALWRTLIDIETDLFTEAVADGDSFFSRQHQRHIIPYSLSRGTLDFHKSDSVEVRIPHPKKADDWLFIGKLDLDLTNGRTLAIDASQSRNPHISTICRDGTNIRFVSFFETDSRNRREKATTRILGHRSIIPRLIDYFDPEAEPPVENRGQSPSDGWLKEKYDLNRSQRASFRHIWSTGPVGFLQGPPGTGKTTFIAAFVHYGLTEGGMRNVLIASQSHEAVNGAAEDILKLFREAGEHVSLVRVGQEGVVSDPLLPYHSAKVETLYRERFKARLKENYRMAGQRLHLTESFVDAFFDVAVTLRPVLRQIENLNEALADKRIVTDAHEIRTASLWQTASQMMGSLGLPEMEFSLEEDADEWFESIVKKLIDAHGIENRENVRRMRQVMRLADDWLGHVGSQRRNFEEFLVSTRSIVCGTCVGLGRSSLGLADTIFDLVVVDEAARCTPGELAVPLQSAKRVLLVGDHLQLEPFHDAAVIDRTAKALGIDKEDLDSIRASDFQRAFQSAYGVAHGQTLTMQHRMVEPIGRLVSSAFYEPRVKLEHGPRKGASIPEGMGPGPLDRPIIWLDTSGYGPKAFQSRSGSQRKSLVNNTEADAIVKLLGEIDGDKAFHRWMTENLDSNAKPIGVICGYAGQKKLLHKKLAAAGFSQGFRDRIKIDTIDSYQGKQNLLVILSLVRNNDDREDGAIAQGFMSRANRINVALSRARDRLVIVGSAARWPTGGPMHKVSEYVKALENEGLARITKLGEAKVRKDERHAQT